ncbi:uncharacterized protein NMK_2412 [Novimethylophilus kurashikiensis]|uniref:Uncharacterized protein n=1 Tax=Novimethylophilus kurashikiensis TaxID=1825523 RepID=A0A2R5FE14_9PROT|nr:hypothetical protein [Novimethylophilus kurashikiensis]GBG14811.1 uncharacterized protein NMK_2412 [Novimethylophilus kurashikiensis]
MAKLFIPSKLKVGFQNRNDTFTGKLAYVTYYDEKGKLRKEGSWTGWIDKSIDTLEIDNKPLAGFVLNKGVQRNGYWGSGRSIVRVHHPDGFEFEISIDNLIGILMHSDVSKRDIVEECVFAWAGSDLVLLPVNSQDYLDSLEYTKKQDGKVSAKSLVPGRQYALKKNDHVLTYVGYYEWFDFNVTHEEIGTRSYYSAMSWLSITKQVSKGKKHVFFDGNQFVVPSVATLSGEVSTDINPDFSAIVDKFFHTTHSQPIAGLAIEPVEVKDYTIDYSSPLCSLYRLTMATDKMTGYERITHKAHGHYFHEQPDAAKQAALVCSSLGQRDFDVTFNNGFTQTSAGNEHTCALPFDAEGKLEDVVYPSDIQFVGESVPGYLKPRYSARYVALLNKLGYGHLRYKLQNGNISKGEKV